MASDVSDPGVTLQVRGVPSDLHREARVLATERGESLRALVIRALAAEVERLRAERKPRGGAGGRHA